MKKNILTLFLAVICIGVAFVGLRCAGLASEKSVLEMNVEALSQGEGSIENTGPGKIVKCIGNSGHRKLCMCENKNPCTESDCQ